MNLTSGLAKTAMKFRKKFKQVKNLILKKKKNKKKKRKKRTSSNNRNLCPLEWTKLVLWWMFLRVCQFLATQPCHCCINNLPWDQPLFQVWAQVLSEIGKLKAHPHRGRISGRITQTNWWICPRIESIHCCLWGHSHLNYNLSLNSFRNQKNGFVDEFTLNYLVILDESNSSLVWMGLDMLVMTDDSTKRFDWHLQLKIRWWNFC